jgi:hypothetical protein
MKEISFIRNHSVHDTGLNISECVRVKNCFYTSVRLC